MDRALQERVTGAIVLVVMAVLIVPVFLDGPADEAETVSTAVTLPGQNAQQPATQKIVLNRERSEPVPARAATPAPAGDEAARPKSRPAIEPSADTGATTKSLTGMWAVQMGSFSSQENAERLAELLRKQGYAAFLSQHETGTGAQHRVRIGPQKDRESAVSVAAQLARSGHTGQVVPHP